MKHKYRVENRKSKIKSLGVATLLTFAFSLSTLQAQTMYVKQSNGTQTEYTLSGIRKMTFSSGNLTVSKSNNSNSVYVLSGLRYLKFSDNSTGLKPALTVQSQQLNVYPNPVGNMLNIDLAGMQETKGTVSIINFEGKTVLSRQVNNEGVLSLDISHLPMGIYLCRYSNATEIKTVKIIKQ
jgi:hypothetical protein